MSAAIPTLRTAAGVVLTEAALDVGLQSLRAAFERERQRLELDKRDRRLARRRAARAIAQQRSLA
jgi:hypothetical protein